MALLLLRHALSVTDADADDDPSTFFSVSNLSSYLLSSSSHHTVAVLLSKCYGEKKTSLIDHYPQLFLLRAAGFLLPCYIMAWAISILQRRRQRQVSVSFKIMFYDPLQHRYDSDTDTNTNTVVIYNS